MSIASNIKAVQQRIKKDKKYGVKLKGLAVKAIYQGMTRGGKTTPEWEDFMEDFSTNPQEWARLTTDKTDCNNYTASARAYLVGNACCLPITETTLAGGIGPYLDATLGKHSPDDGKPKSSPRSRRRKPQTR